MNHYPLSPEDVVNLQELVRLMDEAYDHYFKVSDGYHKSSEGYVGLHFNNYFDREYEGLQIKTVEVYSYVFGPSRCHEFGSIAEALAEVRGWHELEMGTSHEEG